MRYRPISIELDTIIGRNSSWNRGSKLEWRMKMKFTLLNKHSIHNEVEDEKEGNITSCFVVNYLKRVKIYQCSAYTHKWVYLVCYNRNSTERILLTEYFWRFLKHMRDYPLNSM